MGHPALKRIVGLAPPGLRRAGAGFLLDLKSLPARLRDPTRRGEPLQTLHNVGDGDYRALGEGIRDLLREYAGLASGDRVLDIGCGTGRAAGPLAEVLGPDGRYTGFDISRMAIRMCRRRFRGRPSIDFVHLDVWNGDYNRSGKVAEAEVLFPAEDASIDVAVATSVFTHMRLAGVQAYLREAARVLKPTGRLVFTAFTLGDGREGPMQFDFIPFEAHSAVVDPRSPERAIAHQRGALEAALTAAGLKTRSVRRGQWRAPADYTGGQDLWVAVRS